MPRHSNKLTALTIRAATPGKKLFDGGGLLLLVRPNQTGYWRLKYRFGGVEKNLAFGVWPEVGLAEARSRRDEARQALRSGVDPGAERQSAKERAKRDARGALNKVAAEWLAFKRRSWSPATFQKAEYVVHEYILPALRGRNVATLATKDVTKLLQETARTAPDLARKARQYLSGMVDYAIREGLREDGKLLSLKGAIPPTAKGHVPAATTTSEVAALVRAIAAYSSPVTKAALQLAMLTAMRPGVVASAMWSEIDFDAAEWHVPAERMKTRHAHIVPLTTRALALLHQMKELSGGGRYVFPSPAQQATPHLHRDALSKALRQMGFGGRHATHGFRGMFRTVGRERLGIAADVLEAQLAHAKKGEVAKAYDRTTFGDERRIAMQKWDDYLLQFET